MFQFAGFGSERSNFQTLPVVYRGAYEYSLPDAKQDWLPQNTNLGEPSEIAAG
jgi:hypothetical protein